MRRFLTVILLIGVLTPIVYANVFSYRFDIPLFNIKTNVPLHEIYSIVEFLTKNGIHIASQRVTDTNRYELEIAPQRGIRVVIVLQIVQEGIHTEGSYVEMTAHYEGGVKAYYYAVVRPLILRFLQSEQEEP